MSKRENELKITPENMLRDLKVVGVSLRLSDKKDIVISGLTSAMQSDTITPIITPGARQMIVDSIRAMKSELVAYLDEQND